MKAFSLQLGNLTSGLNKQTRWFCLFCLALTGPDGQWIGSDYVCPRCCAEVEAEIEAEERLAADA